MVVATKKEEKKVVDPGLVQKATGVKLWKLELETGDTSLATDFVPRFDITLTGSVTTNRPLGELNQKEYEEELARYRRPHYHFTDEIRFIKDGTCVIDVRSKEKEWFRLQLQAGDVLQIPAELVHSVNFDMKQFVKASGYYKPSLGKDDNYIPRYEEVGRSKSVEQLCKENLENVELKQV